MGALALTACVSGKPDSGVYIDKSGTAQRFESPREMCERTCNESYARCGDTSAAQRRVDSSQDLFGGPGSCNRELLSCMTRCKGI